MIRISKSILGLFVLAFIGVSQNAHSANPLPLESIPKFYGWQALWDQGHEPSEESLIGTWKYAGAGAKDSCRNFVLKGKEDEYNPKGIPLPSGRFAELVFDHYVMNMPSGSQVKVLSYRSKNFLGNQGPYKYRTDEPQISFLVKSQSGHTAPDSNVALSCRLIRDRIPLLVCASKLNLSASNLWNQEAQLCSAESTGFFLAWVKK